MVTDSLPSTAPRIHRGSAVTCGSESPGISVFQRVSCGAGHAAATRTSKVNPVTWVSASNDQLTRSRVVSRAPPTAVRRSFQYQYGDWTNPAKDRRPCAFATVTEQAGEHGLDVPVAKGPLFMKTKMPDVSIGVAPSCSSPIGDAWRFRTPTLAV